MTGPSRSVILGLVLASIASSFVGFGPPCIAARASPPFSESLSHVADKYTREIEAIYHDAQDKTDEELKELKEGEMEDTHFLTGDPSWGENGPKYKLIWDYFMPVYNCATQEKLGITPRLGDNGKWTCGVRTLLQKEGCVVYSFGSNGETSYEEDILRKTVCEVHTFDPTLTAKQEAKVLAVPGINLHKVGLAAEPGELELAMAYQSMGKNISRFPVDSLENLMAELGHDWVDVLKIDIEGGEWAVLKALLKTGAPLPFTQLQVEYHYFRSEMTHPSNMLEVLKELEARNVRVFHTEPNYWFFNKADEFMEYAYIQVDEAGNIVTGLNSRVSPFTLASDAGHAAKQDRPHKGAINRHPGVFSSI